MEMRNINCAKSVKEEETNGILKERNVWIRPYSTDRFEVQLSSIQHAKDSPVCGMGNHWFSKRNQIGKRYRHWCVESEKDVTRRSNINCWRGMEKSKSKP